MKKLFIIAVVLAAVSAFAQGGYHEDYMIKNNAGGTGFYLTGTEDDTSQVYKTSPTMSLRIFQKDTTSVGADSDSSACKYELQISPDSNIATGEIAGYKTIRSWTISRDSVLIDTMITDIAIPNSKFCRFILTGQSTNKKKYAAYFGVVLQNFYSNRPW